jgi:hypothetical protein
MPGFCCSNAGYQTPLKVKLLNRLEQAGVEMPAGAKLWGPGDGWAWRLAGVSGPPREGQVRSRWTIRALAEADGIVLRPQEDGSVLVEPAQSTTPD